MIVVASFVLSIFTVTLLDTGIQGSVSSDDLDFTNDTELKRICVRLKSVYQNRKEVLYRQ